ncbi:hypothetical protein AMTR_s00001p00270820 [Amborella trichopoda]|uniref:Uncharacterized protein n=1 Tax=Amborella trichopoda TaxID=13333 RepID=W1NM33_AMBTC|nr:hypothetical protein AMTR_s00001p00270820 [Amborella trichopoda]
MHNRHGNGVGLKGPCSGSHNRTHSTWPEGNNGVRHGRTSGERPKGIEGVKLEETNEAEAWPLRGWCRVPVGTLTALLAKSTE